MDEQQLKERLEGVFEKHDLKAGELNSVYNGIFLEDNKTATVSEAIFEIMTIMKEYAKGWIPCLLCLPHGFTFIICKKASGELSNEERTETAKDKNKTEVTAKQLDCIWGKTPDEIVGFCNRSNELFN